MITAEADNNSKTLLKQYSIHLDSYFLIIFVFITFTLLIFL